MAKTADGKFSIRNIVKVAVCLPGVTVTDGARHNFLIKYDGALVGNCALGRTTHTDKHLIPWFKRVTGLSKPEIYQAFRQGYWSY